MQSLKQVLFQGSKKDLARIRKEVSFLINTSTATAKIRKLELEEENGVICARFPLFLKN